MELSCVQEELSRVQEEYARESEEMRETLGRTTEEQHLLQNEAKGLTGVKDTDHAYYEIGKKHQLVQTTPEEFQPEPGMAKQEMHDEATGKKLVCETGMFTCALSCFIITIILYIHVCFRTVSFITHPTNPASKLGTIMFSV